MHEIKFVRVAFFRFGEICAKLFVSSLVPLEFDLFVRGVLFDCVSKEIDVCRIWLNDLIHDVVPSVAEALFSAANDFVQEIDIDFARSTTNGEDFDIFLRVEKIPVKKKKIDFD